MSFLATWGVSRHTLVSPRAWKPIVSSPRGPRPRDASASFRCWGPSGAVAT
ncbi:hypothetical protein A2U01_0116080 [Trifolium medium]|uniref:Uncharacterized protein n=1 Tax=Trifolium medium TaxID=97028 RepID=A0A392W503_9FABA|nr:hypothetical protein [Trifolium medium]